MQTFRSSDIFRCVLLNLPKGTNLVCTRDLLTGDKPASNSVLWKESFANHSRRATVAQWDGNHLTGLASARARHGPRAWEIDRLYLDSDFGEPLSNHSNSGLGQDPDLSSLALELFEHIVREAGGRRAERVFLRLPPGSPIFKFAQRAGFFPYFEETLLESRSAVDTSEGGPGLLDWQELLPEDDYSLFQLYCAATPQPVRTATGLTFDQWRDAQGSCGRRRDWVLKREGRVVAWVGLSKYGKATAAEVLVSPASPELWEPAMDRALHEGGTHSWLVPDYQETLGNLLLRRQFREVAQYTVMIKKVAAAVVKPAMAAVEA